MNRSHRKIILIGYRGSGKTTIGRIVAQSLGIEFVDVDHLVCDKFKNPSIAEIWATHGEKEWRRVEVQTTQELCAGPDRVIALGGGTLMQPGARDAVVKSESTLRVYLSATPEELHRRISLDTQSAATRPSLTHLGGNVEEVRHMLTIREPIYLAVADLIVHVADVTPQNAADQILKATVL